MHTLLLFAVLSLGYATYVPEVPLFVWSGENHIVTHNEQIRGYYTTEAVEDLIKGFWKSSHHGKDGLQKLVNKNEKAELVVLFLDSALSSEELTKYHSSLPTVAEAMKEHSFYVPYVTASELKVFHATQKAVHHALKTEATTYVLASERFIEDLDEEAITRVNSLDKIIPSFTNSKTDILIVFVDDECPKQRLANIDEHVKELEQIFKSADFTNYVSIFTGLESSLEEAIPTNAAMGVPEVYKRAVLEETTGFTASNGTYPPVVTNGRNWFNTYFGAGFFELSFVIVFVFGLLFFGISQLLLLQAPDRIPAQAQANKKKKQ